MKWPVWDQLSGVLGFYPHNTPRTPDVWVFHTKQFYADATWVSLQLNSIWHYLPKVSIRVYQLRVQSHKTVPHFTHQLQVWGCHLYFWMTGYASGIAHNPLIGFSSLLQWLTKLRKTFTVCTGQMKRHRGQGEGKVQSFYALSRCAALPAPPCFHQHGSSLNPFS